MFSTETLTFLTDLAANNDRDWFAANKARFEADVKAPAVALIDRMNAELDRTLGMKHRGKLFRIHRDVRFSKDKTPYNPHIHISLAPIEPTGAAPVWMIGLAPEYFTFGCGAFAFEAPVLTRFRDHVAAPDGAETAAIVEKLVAAGTRFDAPELKRVPAPFDREHSRGALLRRKGLVGWIDASPEQGLGDAGFDRACAGSERLRPLFDLLHRL